MKDFAQYLFGWGIEYLRGEGGKYLLSNGKLLSIDEVLKDWEKDHSINSIHE